MTLVVIVNIYLCANVLLVLAASVLSTLELTSRKSQNPIMYRHLLWIGYGLSIAAVALPLCFASTSTNIMPHTLQVWSSPNMHSSETVSAGHRASVLLARTKVSVSLNAVELVTSALFCLGILIMMFRLVKDVLAIGRIVASAQIMRQHHRFRILVADQVQVPFSLWVPRTYVVVIPSDLLLRPCDLRVAIRHEVQHHRQHDTKWLYFYLMLRAIFFWNPAMHLLSRRILELQELTCDAAIVARRGISAGEYCSSLLWVAEQSIRAFPQQVTMGMIGSSGNDLLKQRVTALLTKPVSYLQKMWVLILSGMAITLMVAVAAVSAKPIIDRRISLHDATRLAAVMPEDGIVIPVNEAVVAQLNRLLGTPDGREILRASIERMQRYEPMIVSKLAEDDLPIDLAAVPLVESGYQNLHQDEDSRHGAGLWMFIAPTARHFALRVDDHQDERLNPLAETDAALRMFKELHSQYGDWGLALLAFNAGNARVDTGIGDTRSHDVWTLINKGYENDPDYVARVMAVILILRTPSLLKSIQAE